MPQPTTDKLLRDLQEGEQFSAYAAIRSINLRQKKDGSSYLSLEFSDRSGRLGGKLWDHIDDWRKTLAVGKIVKLGGTITTYLDKKEIHIEKLRLIKAEDQVDKSILMPVSKRPVDEMRRHLRRLIEGVKHSGLRAFLRRFFDDPEIKDAYFEAPAGKMWHHAYLGGLAEHSLTLAEITIKMAEFYPQADKDLMIAGALLHDIGKLKEYGWDAAIDYTTPGRLVGHINLGVEMLNTRRQAEDFIADDLWDHLIHLVLSHQGSGEQGSPNVPKTLEATLLYGADLMDSQDNAFNRIIQRSRDEGSEWSEYVNLIHRYLYAGKPPDRGDGQLGLIDNEE